jgi:HlyD family type I secretion membrane fusion protein
MSTEVTSWRNAVAIRRKATSVGEVVGAFESETTAVFLATAPKREHVNLYVLVGLLVFAVAVCCVVQLDIVVTGTGSVAPVEGLLYVSPFSTSIVRNVNVKAGDVVKKGQPLATLDPTFTQADLKQFQVQLDNAYATIAREKAEVADSPFVPTGNNSAWALQFDTWTKRQAQYKFSVHNYDSQIESTRALIAQYRSDVDKYTQRLKIAGDVEHIYTPLLDKGYVSQLQVMSATDSRTEMSRLLADAQQQVDVNTQTMNSLIAQKGAYIQGWHSDTANQLALDQNNFAATQDSLTKAEKYEALNSLDSPADAVVLKVGKIAKNSVYAGGGQDAVNPNADPLITLMPLDAPLFAEVNIQSQDVGFVKVGQPVRMKLDAYLFLEYGVAKGVVKSISESSFTLDQNNNPTAPYFKMRVAITEVKLRHVAKGFRLLPGNTLTGDVIVGRRSIMSYLVDGALRQTSEAMREP